MFILLYVEHFVVGIVDKDSHGRQTKQVDVVVVVVVVQQVSKKKTYYINV